ncbi:putative nucleotidyltransferase [compost metagenome]
MHHYLHMARGNYREYLQGEQVKIKKYFYVLRPILACEWIERHNTMPPMEFDVLVDGLVPEGSELKAVIHKLLVRKKAGEEMDYEPRINPINEFLEDRLVYYEGMASSLPVAEVTQDAQLDRLFRAALQEVWEETGRCL